DGDDILIGGIGNDFLIGGNGEDVYIHNLGDGDDIIQNYDTSADRKKDRLVFGEGISAEDIEITRKGYDMVLTNIKTGEKVTVQSAYCYTYGENYLENIEFADGTVWTKETIENNTIIRGSEGNDNLYGYTVAYGYTQDETFYAGAGNDYLYGGAGNDMYIFNQGDGCDVISDNDSTAGNEDILQIGAEAKNISFTRQDSNLLVSLLDTEDTITITNWYQGDGNKIETINSSDGYALSHTQVDLLIQSMASFESTSGMSWSEGIRQGNADIDSITAQIWVKQVG
ncbi:MAG: hypothetical protein IJF03_06630, partial [Lachnospiraceae bacterium]|nr:hypothetical protein [Lachnospiraceae bacterium]